VVESSSGFLAGDALDSAANPLVGGAAADVASHGFVDLLAGWMGIFCQESHGLHDLSRLAVTALWNLLGNPGALDRVAAIRRETFNRGDLLRSHRANERLT
jgi:hypothetical protein